MLRQILRDRHFEIEGKRWFQYAPRQKHCSACGARLVAVGERQLRILFIVGFLCVVLGLGRLAISTIGWGGFAVGAALLLGAAYALESRVRYIAFQEPTSSHDR